MKALSLIGSIFVLNISDAFVAKFHSPKIVNSFKYTNIRTESSSSCRFIQASPLSSLFGSNGSGENSIESSQPKQHVVSNKVEVKNADLTQTLKVGSFFALWYAFNIGYNIYNKQALNMLPLPFVMASIQLIVGLFYVIPLWILRIRKAPIIADGSMKNLSMLGFLHMMTHVTAVLSLGAGAVSFTHIIKAAEPVFTAALSALLIGQIFAFPVYLSLLPVIGGVALASMKELSFSWVAFGNAMGSNTFSALRGIVGKKQMGSPVGKNMNAANLYAVLTIIAVIILTPISLLIEGAKIQSTWLSALANGFTRKAILTNIFLSGFFYYLYNEVAFLALESVHPITHAVGNTIKRVVVIASSVIFFRTPMSTQSIIGSSVAVLGTLLYSLVKQKYDQKKMKK